MEKVILFNTSCTEEIKKLLAPMHLQVIEADTLQYNDSLQNIANGKTDIIHSNPFTGKVPDESLILFCGINSKKLDKILFKLRNNKNINVTYKAVLTPSNSGWTVLHLFLELAKEQAAYNTMQKQQNTP
ncbi:MAG: DUF3783 domain-containing protein [Lachnospiraceae bacterium]|nr:DUF3783 domain-containing protein [Lachnospiraceae bacterium]